MSFSPAAKAFVLNNGKNIPWIGFGSASDTWQKSAKESILSALKAGFTHVDTAENYYNEDTTGDAIAEFIAQGGNRNSIFVTTKLDHLDPGKTARDHLQESLKRLKLDYVDLYLIHQPTTFVGEAELKIVWNQFEDVYREGLAKNIGVSNYRIKDFEAFIGDVKVIPACNQIEFNPYLLEATKQLLDYHKKHGILATSYGSLFPLTVKKEGPVTKVLSPIAARIGGDEGQVLLKWQIAKNVLPISFTSRKERMPTLLKTVDLPDLTEAEIAEIDRAGSQLHFRRYQLHMDY